MEHIIASIFEDIFQVIATNTFAPVGATHIRIIATSPLLKKTINFPALDLYKYEETVKQLLYEIEKTLQSASEAFYDKNLKITIQSYTRKTK